MSGPAPPRGAGAAAVGGGTLLAVLASLLPEGTLRTALIWLAPSVTVGINAAWTLASGRLSRWQKDSAADHAFAEALAAVEAALSTAGLTPEQRADFEQERVRLYQQNVERKSRRADEEAKEG